MARLETSLALHWSRNRWRWSVWLVILH